MNTRSRIATATLPPWKQSFRGYHWYDMPGGDIFHKRCNFALFRRGKMALEELSNGEGTTLVNPVQFGTIQSLGAPTKKAEIRPRKTPQHMRRQCDDQDVKEVIDDVRNLCQSLGISVRQMSVRMGMRSSMFRPSAAKIAGLGIKARLEAVRERLRDELAEQAS